MALKISDEAKVQINKILGRYEPAYKKKKTYE